MVVVEFGLCCIASQRGAFVNTLPLLNSCLQGGRLRHQTDNLTWETHPRPSTAVAHSSLLARSSSGRWVGT